MISSLDKSLYSPAERVASFEGVRYVSGQNPPLCEPPPPFFKGSLLFSLVATTINAMSRARDRTARRKTRIFKMKLVLSAPFPAIFANGTAFTMLDHTLAFKVRDTKLIAINTHCWVS